MGILRVTLDSWRDLAQATVTLPGDEPGDEIRGTIVMEATVGAGGVLAPSLHSVPPERDDGPDHQGIVCPWSADLVDPTDAQPSGWGWRIALRAPGARDVIAILTPEAIAATPQIAGVRTMRLEQYVGLSDVLGTGGLVTPLPGSPGPQGTSVVGARDNGDGTVSFLLSDSTYTAPVTVPPGPAGAAATLAVGTVQTLTPGSPATATNTGTSSTAVLNLGIPAGQPGTPGSAATVAVGTVTTGAAGSAASVTNTGSPSAATLAFTIPRGDPGAAGTNATNPAFTVATGAAGSNVALSGTYPNLLLTVPRGADGSPTAHELRGSGSPFGVVTPASAGIYYTDVTGVCGAWRWMSTGTTNTSWAVVMGDTGWRLLDPAVTFLQAGTSTAQPLLTGKTSLYVKRVGATVYASSPSIQVDRTASPSALTDVVMPSGFAPSERVARWAWAYFGAVDARGLDRHSTGRWVSYATQDTPWPASTYSPQRYATTTASWLTSDPWPTTLPGIAA